MPIRGSVYPTWFARSQMFGYCRDCPVSGETGYRGVLPKLPGLGRDRLQLSGESGRTYRAFT